MCLQSWGRSQEALEGKYVPAKGVPGPLHPYLLQPTQLVERHEEQRRLDPSLADLTATKSGHDGQGQDCDGDQDAQEDYCDGNQDAQVEGEQPDQGKPG